MMGSRWVALARTEFHEFVNDLPTLSVTQDDTVYLHPIRIETVYFTAHSGYSKNILRFNSSDYIQKWVNHFKLYIRSVLDIIFLSLCASGTVAGVLTPKHGLYTKGKSYRDETLKTKIPLRNGVSYVPILHIRNVA